MPAMAARSRRLGFSVFSLCFGSRLMCCQKEPGSIINGRPTSSSLLWCQCISNWTLPTVLKNTKMNPAFSKCSTCLKQNFAVGFLPLKDFTEKGNTEKPGTFKYFLVQLWFLSFPYMLPGVIKWHNAVVQLTRWTPPSNISNTSPDGTNCYHLHSEERRAVCFIKMAFLSTSYVMSICIDICFMQIMPL